MTATARRAARRPANRRHLEPVADAGASVGYLTIVGISLFMGTLLATVAVQTLLFQSRIAVEELEERLVAENERAAQLEAEVATLESPARILAEARARLQMAPAADREYLASVVPGDVDQPIPPPGDDPFGHDAAGHHP